MPLSTLFFRISNPADRAAGIAFLHTLLRLPAALFGIVVRLRNRAYDRGWLRQIRLPVRVISVGGLTVGGAGKTPVVRHLARLLTDAGQRVAILSRGYGRRSTDTVVVSDENGIRLSWEESGDEPYLLAATLPDVPVIVGADRVAAGNFAIQQYTPDILLMDDGFQHRRLHRDCNVVVIDAATSSAHLMPAGSLREPWSSLHRADLVVLTRIDQTNSLEELCTHIRRYNGDAPIVETVYRPTRLRRLSDNESYPVDRIAGSRVHTLAGIANPRSFEETVRRIGADVVHTLRFRDHHPFRSSEIVNALSSVSQGHAEWVVTTEKDAVRIPQDGDLSQILALDIELEVVEGKEGLQAIIEN